MKLLLFVIRAGAQNKRNFKFKIKTKKSNDDLYVYRF